jgi:carbon-monoxide dehydrogenase medium subunit
VKCAPFDYVRAASIDEAVKALVDAEGEGKLLAGGQSLVPLLALRMARPSVLVDVNRIPGLAGVRPEGPDGSGAAAVRVGALTRHVALTRQTHHPLLAEAARWIGHTAIRTRGTAGGSIAHADPSAELPVVAVGTGATVTVAGPAGTRTVPAGELFVGALMTSLADDEMIVDVAFPVPSRWGFAEFARRHGDFALVTAVVADVAGHADIAELPPLVTVLRAPGEKHKRVRIHVRLTELGTLELWCVSRDGADRWKLEYSVREEH